MEELDLATLEPVHVPAVRTRTWRDIVSIGFRRRRAITWSFLPIMAIIVGVAALFPRYESEMTLLVEHARVDPVVSAENQQQNAFDRPLVTEEELNSEISLMTSDDVLRKVVLDNHLQDQIGRWTIGSLFRHGLTDEERIARAVDKLKTKLHISTVQRSHIIDVTYTASDPQLAQAVLHSLSAHYLEKHVDVRRPPGQFEFFDTQAKHYREELDKIDAQLASFPQQNNAGAVVAQQERDQTVQKIGDLNMQLKQTQVSIDATSKRIVALLNELRSTSPRITTQLVTSDNPQLMQKLKGTLLDLQLKRTDLLQKYSPTYPLVQEVDKQLAETKASIAAAEQAPLRDQTTDRDNTYEWIRGELAKSTAELQGLRASEAATRAALADFTGKARQLNDAEITQHNLLMDAKQLEDSYLLYTRKREEARISDQMDLRRMMNVSVAQLPNLPVLPKYPLRLVVLVGALFAALVAAGTAFTKERIDHSFHTPDDVSFYLGVPVLAALPHSHHSRA